MSRRYFVFVSLSLLFLSACSSDVFLVHNGNMPSDDKIAQIKTGQTQSEVEYILGSPSAISTLDKNAWLYMSSTVRKVAFLEPKILDRNVLVVYFNDNDEVVKISKLDKGNGQDITVDKEETSSQGHDIGFFKKYFGGVGSYMPIAPSKDE